MTTTANGNHNEAEDLTRKRDADDDDGITIQGRASDHVPYKSCEAKVVPMPLQTRD